MVLLPPHLPLEETNKIPTCGTLFHTICTICISVTVWCRAYGSAHQSPKYHIASMQGHPITWHILVLVICYSCDTCSSSRSKRSHKEICSFVRGMQVVSPCPHLLLVCCFGAVWHPSLVAYHTVIQAGCRYYLTVCQITDKSSERY